VVNVYGFESNDRYFPDRRDLNRSFPGSARGSLASRVAHTFMTNIVSRCGYGIDLHTGSDHRINLPQIRGQIDDEQTRQMAMAFGAPIVIHSKIRDGSLRGAAGAVGARVLVYEGGEPSRFDEYAISVGTNGVLRTLQHLGIIRGDWLEPLEPPLESERTSWARAARTGILLSDVNTGDWVTKGDVLARIVDATGHHRSRVTATTTGLIIGKRLRPIVNQGDAVFHIAQVLTTQPAAPTAADRETGDLGDDTMDGATGPEPESGPTPVGPNEEEEALHE
jgi:predicted deacylase